MSSRYPRASWVALAQWSKRRRSGLVVTAVDSVEVAKTSRWETWSRATWHLASPWAEIHPSETLSSRFQNRRRWTLMLSRSLEGTVTSRILNQLTPRTQTCSDPFRSRSYQWHLPFRPRAPSQGSRIGQSHSPLPSNKILHSGFCKLMMHLPTPPLTKPTPASPTPEATKALRTTSKSKKKRRKRWRRREIRRRRRISKEL